MASALEFYADPTTIGRSPYPAAEVPVHRRAVVPPPQSTGKISDLHLRVLGAVLIGIAAGSIRLLITLMHTGVSHALTPVEFLSALIGVVTGCLGNILIWHGSHINDQCEISQRWRRY